MVCAAAHDTSVNACSVVYEEDTDFDPIQTIESPIASSELKPSQKIDRSRLVHLNKRQRIELLAVLDKYPVFFRNIRILY